MSQLLFILAGSLPALLRSRADLLIENIALRQQVAVLKGKRPRPRLSSADRLFRMLLRRCWSGWENALRIVQPATVVRWHRAGFRNFRSCARAGNRSVDDRAALRRTRRSVP